MATSWRIVMIVVVFLYKGGSELSAAGQLDDIEAQLSSLEARQRSAQDLLGSLEQQHVQDVDNMTQFCQGLQVRVDEHKELLENIQQALEEKKDEDEGPGPIRDGPCNPNNHEIIDDIRRMPGEVYDGYDHLCDSGIRPGWYRFLLEGENAVIPTECVPERNCQTHAPNWIDLQGQSIPAPGEEAYGRACSNWVGDCCNWEVPITVLNCGDYLVYDITPTLGCEMAYCAEYQD